MATKNKTSYLLPKLNLLLQAVFSVTFKRFSRLRSIAVVVLMTVGFVMTYFLAATPMAAQAATDSTLNFQARLENSSGAIAPDGTYTISFHLFNASSSSGSTDTACGTDANCEWTEEYTGGNAVHVANGYLTVNLGSITAFPNTINWDQQQYLTMDVYNGSSWDGQMSPRLPLTAIPYAFRAGTLVTGNGTYSSSLTLAQPASSTQSFVINDQGAAGTYAVLTGGSSLSGATAGVVLQSGTPGTAQTGNFNVSGTGLVGSLQVATSGSIDTSSAGTLYIGTSNATGITLGQNVTFANGASRALVIATAASGVGNQLTIHAGNGASGSTGGNLLLQGGANGTANGVPGSVIVKANGGDSTTAFEVQNASGVAAVNIDTTINELSINSSGAAATLGSELITTTDFTNAAWTSTNWATTTTTATHNTGNTSALSSNQFTAVAGNTYQVTFTVTGSPTASATITPYIGAVAGRSISGNVTNEVELITAAGTTTPDVSFVPTSAWNGTISAVSVKLITGSNAGLSIIDATSSFPIQVRTSGVFGNTFVGNSSGENNTTGNQNTGFGEGTLSSDTTGHENTATGRNALEFNTTGNYNTAIGRLGLQTNVSGSNNTSLGYAAGISNITGSNNTFIGTNADLGSSATGQLQNATAIGAFATVAENNSISLGCVSGTNSCTTNTLVGVDTASPGATLDVQAISSNVGVNVNTTGTGNLLQLQNTGAAVATITSTGATTLKNSANSTTAFQVQNAASDQLLNVNTTQSSLIANPDFEGGTTNWSGVNTGVLTQNNTASNVYYGNDSLAIALGATANSGTVTSTYTTALTAGTYSLSFMAKGSAALTGLTASLGSGTCTLNTTTVSTTYAWYYCIATTTGSPVVKITVTTTSQTLYLDGVELDSGSTPAAFRPGSENVEGSLVVNGSQLQAANSQFALTVNSLTNGQAGGGGGLFIQGSSSDLYQNALVVANSVGTDLFTVNDTVNSTTITGGSSFWSTPALGVSNTDSGAIALSVSGVSSGQTANIVQVTGNGLTTGNAVSISSTSAAQSAGSLLNVSDTATLVTSGGSDTGSLVNVTRSLTSNISGSGTVTPSFDNGTYFGTTSSTKVTSISSAITVNSGHANYYLVVAVFDDQGNSAPTLTYNGTSMGSPIVTGGIGNSGGNGVWLYGMVAPSTGTNTLTLTGGSGDWMVAAEDFYNVNQTTPYGGTAHCQDGSASGSGTTGCPTTGNNNPTVGTLSTTSGDMVTDLFVSTAGLPGTPNSGQTQADYGTDSYIQYGPGALGQSYKQAVGSTTAMNWTLHTASYWWGAAALDLKGATVSNSESVTGAVASISNSCTTTAGTCTDGTNVLQLSQNYSSSTGAVLNIQNSGSGNLISATGSNTAFQIQTNGNLIIADSLSSPTTAIRLRAIASGDNIETAGEDMWLSGWTNANFTGTQLYYARGDIPTGDLFIGNAELNGTSNANSNEGVTLLVLDATANSSSDAGDPSDSFNGSMYYNTYTNEFRCYQNSEWRNCVNSVQSWANGGFAATGTTTSTTFANYPGSNSSLSFTKAASSTNLLVHIDVNPWTTVAPAELDLGVRINGTDYTCGELYYNYSSTAGSTHIDASCTVIVTGIAAGSQTAQIRWARSAGTGTLNTDASTWGDMSVQETD